MDTGRRSRPLCSLPPPLRPDVQTHVLRNRTILDPCPKNLNLKTGRLIKVRS